MNFNSLTAKITFIFIWTLALFIGVLVFYTEYENRQSIAEVSSYHEKLSRYLGDNRLPMPEVIHYIEQFNFKQEHNPHAVMENGKIVYATRGFETILWNGSFYLHITAPDFRVMFKDVSVHKINTFVYIVFVVLFILLLTMYAWLIKSLQPLHDLKAKIARFSQGDFEIDCASDKKDEIAEVANEFDNAVKKIALLLHSRQLFLRTVMHELKTPLAKGRIVSELIDDKKQKNRIILIFEKLNLLIDDFAKIEQIVSKHYVPTMDAYRMDVIIEKSIGILMLEETDNIVLQDLSSRYVTVDLDLIALAVKNLIDNALKYSNDTKVIIKEETNQLLFISDGIQLKKPLAEYFKPFHADRTSKNQGMGLGLYIVHSILRMHHMHLEYEYKENQNIFKIILEVL